MKTRNSINVPHPGVPCSQSSHLRLAQASRRSRFGAFAAACLSAGATHASAQTHPPTPDPALATNPAEATAAAADTSKPKDQAGAPAAAGGAMTTPPSASPPPKGRQHTSDLLLFEDIPVVVTASRGARPISLSAVPVSILTASDIHYGGFTNIADALRFVPGVDVLRTDRNRIGVGVRGLNHWAAERTLTLLDGRDTELPFLGSPDFFSLPVLMEDIERVEVVRGPGGAAWGANALNGVINIITKEPDQTQGVLVSTQLNEFGETYSQFRWGAADGNWSWRLSAGYQEHKSSDDAIANDNFVSHDFNREVIVDTKAVYKPSTNDKLSFGIAYSGADRSDTSFTPFGTGGDERLDDARLFARFDHQFDDGGSAYLQWSGAYDNRNQPDLAHAISYSNNLDGQMTFPTSGAHTLSFGGNFRWSQLDVPQDQPIQFFLPDGTTLNEYSLGAFVQDRYELTSRLSLEGQVRVDYDSRIQADWSGRLALIYALDEQQRHVIRIAAARAFRSVGPQFREAQVSNGLITSFPGLRVPNEGVWALEAGYNGRLLDSLTLRVDAYVQRHSDMIGLGTISPAPIIVMAANSTAANAYGLETELALKGDAGQISAWYAYHGFSIHDGQANIRAYTPPSHSVGLTGRLNLADGVTANANYRYSNVIEFPNGGGFVLPISPTHRLDLTLSKSFADGQCEVMIGVADVFNRTVGAGQEVGTGASRLPGRMVFARVQMKF